MNILAIETSVPTASLCLYADGEVVCRRSWTAERNHDAYLFPALQEAMDTLGDRPLHDIVVGAGPGSYGGVRVALAAGVGIAAVKEARLVAVCSWAQLTDGTACVVSDARRGGWTLRRPSGDICILTTEELKAELEAGTPVRSTEEPGTFAAKALPAPAEEGVSPTAEGLVQTWLGMTEEERAAARKRPAEPIYVRPPHITKALHKPWEIRK